MAARGTPGRVKRCVALLLAGVAVLALGACGPPERDLPERPPLADQQAIDLCALAPLDQVADEVSDTIGRGWMRQTLGECWFTSPAGSFWLDLAPDALPVTVAEEDPEVEVTAVEGGLIVNTDYRPARCGGRTLVSDTGYIIDVNGPATWEDAVCEMLDALGRLVLANLAAGVPTIDWPEGTVGHVDLCAAIEEAGVDAALGFEGEVTARSANHFACELGDHAGVIISFDARVSLVEGSAQTDIEVAGRPGLSTDGGCTLAIDLGENKVLAEMMEGGRDSLDVSITTPDIDCTALPEILDPLVRSLAH